MTEEPSFETLGVPTVQQVRDVWDGMPYPSSRKVAEEMTKRGWKIIARTVARYQESDWRERDRVRQIRGGGTLNISPADKADLDRALARLQDHIQETDAIGQAKPEPAPEPAPQVDQHQDEAEPQPRVAPAPPPVVPQETAFDARDRDLMAMTDSQLRKLRARRRIVAEIHILDMVAAKAHVMVLAPKETGALITAMSENETRSDKPEIGVPGDNARPVTPKSANGHGEILDLQPNPPDPVGASIAKFRQKLGR